MAHRLLRNVEADGWERSDFPIICESCLGDNPYVRMTKADYDKECKTCTRPFTIFRWRSGRDARFKKTEICQTCSKLKNVCQVCILDLEYGLPVQVRDTAMAINSTDVIPKSDVNREFFAEEHDRKARAGIDYESSYGKARPSDTILKLQRTAPYYKRNRAHVCSFYIRGECTRGAECPYRHEMPITGELAQQNIKDRYYGVNDPVAMKLLNKAGEMPSLEPPEDESIRTLYVGGLDERITEQDLWDNFYAHGEIESVRMVLQRACAFVTYTTREGAEKAAEELSNKLVIKGLRLKLMWSRPQTPKQDSEGTDAARQQTVAHSGLLPRAVISQQQNQIQDQSALVQHYNMPPPPSSQERTFYPSMDPRRMGAVVRSQDGASSGPPGEVAQTNGTKINNVLKGDNKPEHNQKKSTEMKDAGMVAEKPESSTKNEDNQVNPGNRFLDVEVQFFKKVRNSGSGIRELLKTKSGKAEIGREHKNKLVRSLKRSRSTKTKSLARSRSSKVSDHCGEKAEGLKTYPTL